MLFLLRKKCISSIRRLSSLPKGNFLDGTRPTAGKSDSEQPGMTYVNTRTHDAIDYDSTTDSPDTENTNTHGPATRSDEKIVDGRVYFENIKDINFDEISSMILDKNHSNKHRNVDTGSIQKEPARNGYSRSPEAEHGHYKIGMVVFPPFVNEALERIMKKNPFKKFLKEDIERINKIAQSIHQKGPLEADSSHSAIKRPTSVIPENLELGRLALEYTERDALAFALVQSPYTYAPVERVLSELSKRYPSFVPSKVLDFGCGPGTALWAAKAIWPDTLGKCVGIDLSEGMLTFADKIIHSLDDEKPWIDTVFRRYMAFHSNNKHSSSYNLVISSFTLNEILDEELRKLTLNNLWNMTRDFLVLIDRGTPEGSRLIIEARDFIIGQVKENVQVVAPCPHSLECPMKGSWCHFSQRLQLPTRQIQLMKYKRNITDSRFSYVILRRKDTTTTTPSPMEQKAQNWPRLIAGPRKGERLITMDICTPHSQLWRINVPKSQDPQVYYDARKSGLGDIWPHPIMTKPHVHCDFSRKGRNRTDSARPAPTKPPQFPEDDEGKDTEK